MADEQIVALLREIRAGQQEQLALYREQTGRALHLQQSQIGVQRRAARFYRSVVGVTAILTAGLTYYFYFSQT